MADWQDMSQLTPVNGWYTFRTRSISTEGVTEFVVLTLVDQETDDHYQFALSLDVALRAGYDLVGDGARIVDYEEED